jgi:PPOX class probable F420-dependent enzyme
VSPEEARERFASARVARLATADADGVPHIVPLVFAIAGETIYSAVDPKPKRTTDLKRLRNVAANPRVALLADHYVDDDWGVIWWARADGSGRVLESSPEAVALLRERYAQYRDAPPDGPVLAVDVRRWSGWHG